MVSMFLYTNIPNPEVSSTVCPDRELFSAPNATEKSGFDDCRRIFSIDSSLKDPSACSFF